MMKMEMEMKMDWIRGSLTMIKVVEEFSEIRHKRANEYADTDK